MSAATSLLTPDEQFIQEVLRSGRATRQRISLKALGELDRSKQCRVGDLDLDHCRRLERHADGSDLAPIVVFRDARQKAKGKYHVADGYHRVYTYRNMMTPKRDDIPAIVIDSDAPERETLEYATMCNREMCKERTDADVTNAIEMLLMDEVWRGRSNRYVANHIGCSDTKVFAVRARLNLKMGWPEPEMVTTEDGRNRPYRTNRNPAGGGRGVGAFKPGDSRTARYQASVNGKHVVGKTRDEVAGKVAEIQDNLRERRQSLDVKPTTKFLYLSGFTGITSRTSHPGLHGYHCPGIVCLPCDFSTPEVLPMVIGRLIAARQYKEPTARMIVLCYVEDGPEAMIDLYRQAGFEFMTPDALVESLKDGA